MMIHYYHWLQQPQCLFIGWILLICCYPAIDAFRIFSSPLTILLEGGSLDRFGHPPTQVDLAIVTNHISPRRLQCHGNDNDSDATCLQSSHRTRRRFHQVLLTVGVSSSVMLFGTPDSLLSWKALALTPEQASTAYNSYAAQYDQLDGGDASNVLGIAEARSKLLRRAHGNVLEIGAGTGLNLEYYQAQQITSLTLVDISEGMLEEAKQRVAAMMREQPSSQQQLWKDIPITFVRADATNDLINHLKRGNLGDATSPSSSSQPYFDTVVDSFSLCVMGNEGARKCLYQLRDVVKDVEHGGKYDSTVFVCMDMKVLENSKSSQPLLAWYQDVTAESAAAMGGKGCVYNQDVRALLQSIDGLTIESEESYATGLFRAFVCTKKTALSSSGIMMDLTFNLAT